MLAVLRKCHCFGSTNSESKFSLLTRNTGLTCAIDIGNVSKLQYTALATNSLITVGELYIYYFLTKTVMTT